MKGHKAFTKKAFMLFMVFMVHPALGYAQLPRPGVFVTIGAAQPTRIEDTNFGTHPNVGGLAGVYWRRFGVEIEGNRTLGLKRKPLPCQIERPACLGATSAGLTSAKIVSVNFLYPLAGAARSGPYVSGGVGMLSTEETTSVASIMGNQLQFAEAEIGGKGLALNVGAGFRFRVKGRLSLRPELRIYSSSVHSRLNLSVFRFSIAAGYQW